MIQARYNEIMANLIPVLDNFRQLPHHERFHPLPGKAVVLNPFYQFAVLKPAYRLFSIKIKQVHRHIFL